MECSQAVLMLMLLVPCEQSGGESPETVIAEQHEATPIVQAAPAADQRLPVESVLPAGDVDTLPVTDAEAVARNPAGDPRVSD